MRVSARAGEEKGAADQDPADADHGGRHDS